MRCAECGHAEGLHHEKRVVILPNSVPYPYCCDAGLCTCDGFRVKQEEEDKE